MGTSREFDVVILGASGFTGKYVVAETLKFLTEAPNSALKTLALAGRSPAKLAQALAWASSQNPNPNTNSIPILQCDVSSPSSLAAVAARSRLVLNCVGPFRLYGAPVVSACVDAGTDYLDISGEPEFMERLEAENHEKAIPGPPPKGSLVEHQKSLGLWAIRLPTADAIVVRRTLAALTENPNGLPGVEEGEENIEKRKIYWASVKPAHFGVKLGLKSLLGVGRVMLMGLFMGLFGMFSFGRSLLLKFPKVFSLGSFRKTGPTEEEVRSATFKMWFVGRGYSDSSIASEARREPDTEIITRVSGPEIGYITTPIILVQCALIVLSQRQNLPKGGVFPPGIIFGPTGLQERLQENGISFEVVSKRNLAS